MDLSIVRDHVFLSDESLSELEAKSARGYGRLNQELAPQARYPRSRDPQPGRSHKHDRSDCGCERAVSARPAARPYDYAEDVVTEFIGSPKMNLLKAT